MLDLQSISAEALRVLYNAHFLAYETLAGVINQPCCESSGAAETVEAEAERHSDAFGEIAKEALRRARAGAQAKDVRNLRPVIADYFMVRSDDLETAFPVILELQTIEQRDWRARRQKDFAAAAE